MGLSTDENQGICYINGSRNRILVYPSYVSDSYYNGKTKVSGTSFGWIDPGEMYITPPQKLSPNYYLGAVKVLINYGQTVRTGYIQAGSRVTEPSPSWVASQDPFTYYRSSVKLRYPTNVYLNKTFITTVPAGSTAILASCYTGKTYPRRIYISKIYTTASVSGTIGANWMDIHLEKGALPSNRNMI